MIEKIFRMLPLFKGKQRLARVLLKNKIAEGLDLQLKGKYNCVYRIPNIKENVGFELFINGVYEEEIIDLIIERLPVNGVMLDIGANIGAIAIPVCKRRADINAIAIEASSRVYGYLQHNKELNHLQNCILINKAVTDKDNETVIFFSPEEKFGKGSLVSVFTKEAQTVGALSLDTMFTKEFADWVIQQNGKVVWDIYSLNITDDAKDYLNSLASSWINIKPGVPYHELPAIIKNYAVGVVLYNGHIANYINNAPNKLFEYLACGLDVWFPVVMKGSLPYVTKGGFPKVMAIDFTDMQDFSLVEAIDRNGYIFKPTSFFCEEALEDIANLFLQND